MQPPILADNRGDILVFRTVHDAETYIEPVDAQNNEYIIYDSEGRLLRVRVQSRNRVALQPAESDPQHATEVQQLLQSHLRILGVAPDWLINASLKELIAKRLEYKTD